MPKIQPTTLPSQPITPRMITQEFIDNAQTAYHRYGSVTNHKNWQGLPMPEFEDLPDYIQKAWVAAANVDFEVSPFN